MREKFTLVDFRLPENEIYHASKGSAEEGFPRWQFEVFKSFDVFRGMFEVFKVF